MSDLRMTLATLGVLISFMHISAARAQREAPTNEQTQIVDTVNTIFTAIQTDDAAKLSGQCRCAVQRRAS